MPWTDQYIGIPFEANGRSKKACDCWGLVALVYRDQLGIELPAFDGCLGDCDAVALRKVAKTIVRQSVKWKRCDAPKVFDAILFRANGIPNHIGVAVDKKTMLHVSNTTDCCLERFDSLKWKSKIVGFYRYQ